MFRENILPNDPQMADYKINKRRQFIHMYFYKSESLKGHPFDCNLCQPKTNKKKHRNIFVDRWCLLPHDLLLASLKTLYSRSTKKNISVRPDKWHESLKWKSKAKKKFFFVTAFYYYFLQYFPLIFIYTTNLSENVRV